MLRTTYRPIPHAMSPAHCLVIPAGFLDSSPACFSFEQYILPARAVPARDCVREIITGLGIYKQHEAEQKNLRKPRMYSREAPSHHLNAPRNKVGIGGKFAQALHEAAGLPNPHYMLWEQGITVGRFSRAEIVAMCGFDLFCFPASPFGLHVRLASSGLEMGRDRLLQDVGNITKGLLTLQ